MQDVGRRRNERLRQRGLLAWDAIGLGAVKIAGGSTGTRELRLSVFVQFRHWRISFAKDFRGKTSDELTTLRTNFLEPRSHFVICRTGWAISYVSRVRLNRSSETHTTKRMPVPSQRTSSSAFQVYCNSLQQENAIVGALVSSCSPVGL